MKQKFKMDVFETEEWKNQSERKKNCMMNICNAEMHCGLCTISENVCRTCDCFNYTPLGFEVVADE